MRLIIESRQRWACDGMPGRPSQASWDELLHRLAAGSSLHHHCRGSALTRGHTSSSVFPSYNRPFFITYLTELEFRMSVNGFRSNTCRSASFPTSSDPRSPAIPIASAPWSVAARSASKVVIPPDRTAVPDHERRRHEQLVVHHFVALSVVGQRAQPLLAPLPRLL